MNTLKLLAAALLVLPQVFAQNSAWFVVGQADTAVTEGNAMELGIYCTVGEEGERRFSAHVRQGFGSLLEASWASWSLEGRPIRISYGRLGQPPSVDAIGTTGGDLNRVHLEDPAAVIGTLAGLLP